MTHPLHAALEEARLLIKPDGSISGAVDGAWWPQTRNLPNELAAVLPAIKDRLIHLDRVGYRFSDWNEAPRRIFVDEDLIRLDGYTLQPLETVRLVGRDETLLLAVVPCDCVPDVAHLAMLLAMTGAASQTVHGLNLQAASTIKSAHEILVAEEDWESEGGHPPPGPRVLEEAL